MKGKWKLNGRVVVFTLVVVACLPAQAVGRLNIEIRLAAQASPDMIASDGSIEVVLTNTGDQLIEVLADDAPCQNRRGRLTGSAFELIDTDGMQARYNDIIADCAENTLRTLRLAPNQKEGVSVSPRTTR